MTYWEATLAALKWFGSIIAVLALVGGVAWFIWWLLPLRVKIKVFEWNEEDEWEDD